MRTNRSGQFYVRSSKWALAVLAVGLPALAFVGAGPGLAPSTFVADDGNQATESSGVNAGPDWQNAPANLSVRADTASGQNDNSLVQGTKEDQAVPTIETGSIPNNKSDLLRFGVASETVSDQQFMYLFWTRANILGTANMDFEFNQSSTLSSNGVTPVRTVGDLLITFDFDAGGKNPDKVFLSYSRWTASGACEGAGTGTAAAPCWSTLTSLSTAGYAEGAVNKVEISDYVADASGNTKLPLHTFGEASVNLTASGIIPAGSCNPFASAYLKSRSSTSFTAAMKDFIAPSTLNFQSCGGISIHKQDDVGTALAGAVFTLFNGDPTGTTCSGTAATPAASCTTDTNGNCSLTQLPFGDYCLAETTTPAGYATAPAQDADISSSSTSLSLTFVDPRTFRIITYVCRESDQTLWTSTASLDGGTAIPTLTNAPIGSSASVLCNVPAARFDGLAPGGYPLNVTIPSTQQ
jgi:hypothetical protein